MTRPAYTVNAKGVISIDYLLFREMDPYAVCAATRNNLRVPAHRQNKDTKRSSANRVVNVLVTVGQH